MTDREQLHQDGYILLRQAIPGDWLQALRATFDAGSRTSEQWSVPRGWDWRHSLLDGDAKVQAVCRLPHLLAVVGELIGECFFLAQVEGREPLAGGGHQRLHRDLSAQRPGDTVGALAFFDNYGPENGSTRIVPGSHRILPGSHRILPGSHRPVPGAPSFDFNDESRAVQLSGAAGDILVFDSDLVHAASLNRSGARRRSVLIGYAAQPLYAAYAKTASLRDVRMDTGDRFEPADFAFGPP